MIFYNHFLLHNEQNKIGYAHFSTNCFICKKASIKSDQHHVRVQRSRAISLLSLTPISYYLISLAIWEDFGRMTVWDSEPVSMWAPLSLRHPYKFQGLCHHSNIQSHCVNWFDYCFRECWLLAGADPESLKRRGAIFRPPWLANEENFRFRMV